jgi:hypothetical protein
MIYKEKLINFVVAKDLFIKHKIGIAYITKKDIDEINIWSDNICKKIYMSIVDYINMKTDQILYRCVCPWCVFCCYSKYNRFGCDVCGYGKRHGICHEPYSRYNELVEMDAFLILTKDKYKEIICLTNNKN